ncbi:hypothetical protein D3C77_383750 [compost metagenome]
MLAAEADAVADLEPLAGLHEGAPDMGRVAVVQRRLDLDGQDFAFRPDPLAHARQARRDHPRVVEHQGVAGLQEFRQVADDAILKVAVRHHQQARRVARVGGAQGDARLGQVEVEIGCPHEAGNARAGPRRSSEPPEKQPLANRLGVFMSVAVQ